ncbi:MAG: hypothetical protein IJQ32_02195 [Paludibacteraceae bacterium]|nr:hypothetical protein [Paludibacteraceae bacterium]
MITIDEARQIVSMMKDEFDSHDFILVYACAYTLSYLNILWEYNGDARIADGQIAKRVSLWSTRLSLSKGVKTISMNIKGYKSECTKWTKVK